jgi:hypothetical protein
MLAGPRPVDEELELASTHLAEPNNARPGMEHLWNLDGGRVVVQHDEPGRESRAARAFARSACDT